MSAKHDLYYAPKASYGAAVSKQWEAGNTLTGGETMRLCVERSTGIQISNPPIKQLGIHGLWFGSGSAGSNPAQSTGVIGVLTADLWVRSPKQVTRQVEIPVCNEYVRPGHGKFI